MHLKLLLFLFKIKFLFLRFENVLDGCDSGKNDRQVASHLKIKHGSSPRGLRWGQSPSLANLLGVTSLL